MGKVFFFQIRFQFERVMDRQTVCVFLRRQMFGNSRKRALLGGWTFVFVLFSFFFSEKTTNETNGLRQLRDNRA